MYRGVVSNIPRPSPISAVTTRSMAKTGTLGIELTGAFELRDMRPPTPLPASLQRGTQPAVLRVTDHTNVVRQRATTSFIENQPDWAPSLRPYQRPLEIPQIPARPMARVPFRSRLGGFFNRVRRKVLPNVRYHRLDDSVRLIEHAPRGLARLQPLPIGKRVVRFLKKHKRKFAIAGGALAVGGAIVGGLAGGIPIKEAKKEVLVYADQPKTDMREGHSGTLLELLKVLLVMATLEVVEAVVVEVAVVCMPLFIALINVVENHHQNAELRKGERQVKRKLNVLEVKKERSVGK